MGGRRWVGCRLAGGAVTAIQRSGAALHLNVHSHSLVADGVFVPQPTGAARFVPPPPPADDDVARLIATIRRRVARLARRHGVELGGIEASPEEAGGVPDRTMTRFA